MMNWKKCSNKRMHHYLKLIIKKIKEILQCNVSTNNKLLTYIPLRLSAYAVKVSSELLKLYTLPLSILLSWKKGQQVKI
jgi:hypothetical protein